MARQKTVATLVITVLCLSTLTQASQRSIHLGADGRYRGLVVGFSSDFSAKQINVQDTISNLMKNLQNASNIMNELIGYQFGEVTIVLRDDWNIETSLLNVTDAQFKSLSEADIIFTNDDHDQILTMQSGECGEGGQPINFPMKYMSDEYSMPRLMVHQWLLYRYGVFNEFGYVSDASYPVYFAPSDGGALNHSSPIITSCSNKPEFNYTSQCHGQAIDPNTGRPIDPSCDVVPIENSIQSSFLYAPLVVSEYKLCDKKTHDFVSPNKQNTLCDYQSAQEVISKHADFDIFKHQLAQKKGSTPIQFRIWQKSTPTSPVPSKSNLMYIFPSGYPYYNRFLNIIIQVSIRNTKFQHQAKVRFFNSNSLESRIEEWQPSNQMSSSGIDKPIEGKVDLITVIAQIVQHFHSSKEVKMSGTCLFVFSGSHEVENVDSEQQVEQLAESLNAAGIGLRVVIVDRMPSQQVLTFFERLNSKLTSESSVNFAISPPSSVSIANQVFSTVNTIIWDAIQDITENSHILLKSQTFNPKATINFTIDESFKNLPHDSYWVLVEAFTTGKSNSLEATMIRSIDGKVTKFDSIDTNHADVLTLLYKGEKMKSGLYRLDVKSIVNDKQLVTVSIRVLANTNAYRSYQKESPIATRCWVRAEASSLRQFPLRGYAQLSKGLNGPVYEADVSLIIRRFDTASNHQEFNIPLHDNGHGSPDITARDGIYSAYLDQVLQNSGPAAYSVFARVYSDKLSLKPGNFGNTVMFKNRPRCCGSDLMAKSEDEVQSGVFERLVNCGSFYATGAQSNQNNFSIRDLQLVNIDAENRTVTVQWSTPFIADQNKMAHYELKAFHSVTQHTQLPAEIKESFATLASAETEEMLPANAAHSTNTPLSPYDELYDIAPYEQMATISNSLRTVTLKILSVEEGYYFVAVAEHADDGRKTKASNVVPVYMKSNVPFENTTAFDIDDSKLPEGTRRDPLGTGSLTWVHILIICIGSALILFILILVVICVQVKKRRHATNKQSHVDYEVKKSSPVIESDGKLVEGKPNQYYLNQDASSLISTNERTGVTNSNISNNTSCSSVNTVDNQANEYMTPSHLEPIHRVNGHQHMNQNMQHNIPPNVAYNMTPNSGGGSNQSMLKELSVAQLLPKNSWDAKELLDHWGRVQDAKQRQETPPVMRMQTASPSIPSFGDSSLDNYNQGYSYQYQSPAGAQPSMAGHYVHEGLEPVEYHQSPPMYAPYSNASSILQHHQQQQQYQTQRPYGLHNGMHHVAPAFTPTGYDDNGLPEYSVVRKHPNISQV